ncbi:iron complex outermembrane receptor protein [Tenacibaculum adriaticum]|uniref:Iron complex outermembrane receptor protein n=1 Tax=Tenacibaculum adriaticum TaxID=413713 RepID=A0A5S5DW62_9FLAO|nr:TonB-dependent receptor [Tenacibaculum adriaticum]TYQ00056.1 iron complex outermembrane receptor protein [Tenacibaculum adriaticum]
MKINYSNLKTIKKSIFFVCFFTFHLLYAQSNGSIKGKIFTNDNKAAAYVNIIVEHTNKGAISDENGYYQINSVSPGNHKLTFSLLGLETKSIEIDVSEGVVTKIEDITLNVSEEKLQEVVLEVRRKNKFNQKESPYVSRLPLSNIENPQVYTVITGELLDELQITDIQGALQNAPGISNVMQGIGSGGVGVNLYLRGFSADIAMRNGIGTSIRTSTDQANIERIEVIKGPSGTLFGTSIVSSYGGVVNLVTKKPYETFGGTAGFSTGSNNLSRLTVDINTPLNKENTVLFRLNAAKHAEHSFQDYGLTRNWYVAPALTYKASDRLTLNVEAEIYNNNSPSIYFNPGNAELTTMNDLNYNFENSYGSDYLSNEIKSYNVFAEAKYKLSNNWTSQTLLSSSNSDNSTNYLFLDFLDENDAERRIMNIESQFNTTQIQQNFIGAFKIGNLDNKLIVGLDYYDLQTPYRRTQLVYDVIGADNPVMDFNPKKYENLLGEIEAFRIGQRDQNSFSIYASDVINFTERLSVMASLRLDNYNDKENDYKQSYVAPKFGAVYQIVKNGVSLFANYMNGFTNVAPDLSSGVKISLKPEFATQIEGGVKAELFNGKLSTTLSYYDITVNDAVRYVNNGGTWSQIQDGVKSSKGLEVEVIAAPVKGWNIVAGYANNNSEFIEGAESVIGKTPYAAPETTINLWTSYKMPVGTAKGLGFGFGANHVSDTYVDDMNTLLAPGHTVLNSSVFLDKPTYRIGVKFNNITNEKYWANMGSYVQPQKTRNTVVSFTYKF